MKKLRHDIDSLSSIGAETATKDYNIKVLLCEAFALETVSSSIVPDD